MASHTFLNSDEYRRRTKLYIEVVVMAISCRESLGLTRKELAERMVVWDCKVSNFERFKAEAKFGLLLKYLKSCNASVCLRAKDSDEVFLSSVNPVTPGELIRIAKTESKAELTTYAAGETMLSGRTALYKMEKDLVDPNLTTLLRYLDVLGFSLCIVRND